MQITAFCFDWVEVQKRTSAEQIVEEMIHTDDIDIYTKDLPDGVWTSDSASQHFEAAEQIELAVGASPDQPELTDIATVISTGEALDELGISDLTDGCYFISISPSRIEPLLQSFQRLDVEGVPGLSSDTKDWIEQWKSALEYASSKGFGLIGHCG
jgi:hypothetical protein